MKYKPLLDDANIHYTVEETKYRLHAKEVAHSLDLLRYDGVLCVSGDGILVEVVNGLLEREDWNSAIKMPIGVIPAGYVYEKHFWKTNRLTLRREAYLGKRREP